MASSPADHEHSRCRRWSACDASRRHDADRFVASLLDVGNGQPTIQLVRRSADPISIFVFVRAGWVWNLEKDVAKLEPQAAMLNDTLAAARAGRSV